MLSICIPVYNFCVHELVNELHNQASSIAVDFEIILIDDFSDVNFKNQNKHLAELQNIKYIELPRNIGRSKIRNLFLTYAQYDYLLFLDCDAFVSSKTFLKKYIDTINNETVVVCGGLTYNSDKPGKEYRLRWKYGIRKEVVSFENRLKNPYKSFNTISFLIKKTLFQTYSFDERITGYGHEDTLFGFQLKTHNIPVTHINNPVVNKSLEKNSEFLLKTEQSILNLIYIKKFLSSHADFENSISLLNTYNKLKKTRALSIVFFFWLISHKMLRRLLASGFESIGLFSFYKLGYLINKQQSSLPINAN